MTLEETNWSLCCLCQTNDGGEIRCPAQSNVNTMEFQRYESLSNALSLFEGSHSIPMNIPKFLLNDANLQQTLMINHARFHNPA